MAGHRHWEGVHPRYGEAPVCRFPTKRACDENFTQFLHGHLGTECVKEFQPTKSRRKKKDGTVVQKGSQGSIATCTIIVRPERGRSFTQLLEDQGVTR